MTYAEASTDGELFAGLLGKLGLEGASGRIYGALALAARPLTMKEISRRTGDSLSSVSLHLSSLARLKIVRRFRRGGVFVHEAAVDAVEFFRQQIRNAIRTEVEPLERELNRRLPRTRSKARQRELRTLLAQIHRTKRFLLAIAEISVPGAGRAVA
jgi:DNA-binding transcriptional regulator GbsR (MarR family)